MAKTILAPALALLALAACNSGESETAAPDASLASEAAAPIPTTPMVSPVEEPAGNTIPAAMQGRWGLVAADCEPGRDDAKGLMEVGPQKLTFYESVGTLTRITEQDTTRLRGNFSFTGEGMEWQRDQVLDVQDEGQTLVRREYGQDAAPGPFKYTKCA